MDYLISGVLPLLTFAGIGGVAYLLGKRTLSRRSVYYKAGIVDTMAPLVERHRKADTTIKIIGANGEYAIHNEDWCNKMEKWLKEGNAITYLLINPSKTAIDIYKILKRNHPERFNLNKIKSKDQESIHNKIEELRNKIKKYESDKACKPPIDLDETNAKDQNTICDRVNELLDKYETFHFVLFDKPRQMWIEGTHQHKQNVAFNCEYVTPENAYSDPRYNRFSNNFDLLYAISDSVEY